MFINFIYLEFLSKHRCHFLYFVFFQFYRRVNCQDFNSIPQAYSGTTNVGYKSW